MNLTELKSLVKKGEGLQLEFKKKADYPEKIVRELVAFANTKGGTLLLGVDDAGKLTGLKFPDEDLYVMEAALYKYAKPEIPVYIEIIPIGSGLSIISFQVEQGTNQPYYWLVDKEMQIFKAYVRHKDQSLKASKEMFQILRHRGLIREKKPFQVQAIEQKLLDHLGKSGNITLMDFCKLADLKKQKASRFLVNWVNQGVLEISPEEDFDLYFLSKNYSA